MDITIFKGFVILTFVCSGHVVTSCPVECTCTGKYANCDGKHLKEFPSDLPLMTEVLDMQSNEIEILHKKSMNRLKNLKELKLRFNKIQAIEPGTFRKMPQLKKIDLAANFIDSLPNRIFSGASGLTHLDLSENYLERIDSLFSGLTNLERLDLGGNAIEEITNNSFRDLRKLLFLILSNNNISSIQKNAFKNLNLLSYLVMRNNPIKRLDDILTKNIRLAYVEFANCKLESIPSGLPWVLRYLQLSENNITSIDKSDLLPYKFVGILVLDENQISYIEDGAFSHMDLLQDLWLNVNQLARIPQHLPRGLKSLYLDQNNIKQVSRNDIPFAAKLETLSLRNNKIQEMDAASFQNPGFLKKLYLNGNNFTIISNSTFSHLPHLESLSINRNSLKSIEMNAFGGLASLETLEMAYVDASENCIKGNIFKDLHKLKTLDVQLSPAIANNILGSTGILSSLRELEEINLMDNQIETLSSSAGNFFSHIKTIKLAENNFHCDENLIWLKNWMQKEEKRFFLSVRVKCHTPVNVRGRQLSSLMDEEFILSATNKETTSADVTINTDMEKHHFQNTIIIDANPTQQSRVTEVKKKLQRHTKSMADSTVKRYWTSRYNVNAAAMETTAKTMTTAGIQTKEKKNKIKIIVTSDAGLPQPTSKSITADTKWTDVPKIGLTAITSAEQEPHENQRTSSITDHEHTTESRVMASSTAVKPTSTSDADRIKTSKYLPTSKFVSRKVSINGTKSWRPVLTTLTPINAENKDTREESGLKVTAIATTISVIIFVFISLAGTYFIYTKRKKLVYHRARKYQDDGDVVFYITDSEGLKTIPSSNKLTREDRGSVTSRPSEDITNDYDPEMKVYTWDVD